MYARKVFHIFVFLWVILHITCGEDVKEDRRVTASYSGTTVSSNEGIFSSPGYPGIYPRNYIYRYDIRIGQEKADVVIDFKFFELENCAACSCDSLRIENRLTKALTFCGNTLPNGNGRVYLDNVDDYVWISFSSNGQNEFPGFYATYRVIHRTGSTASYGGSVCPPLSCPVCTFGQTAHYDYGGVCPYCYCRYNDIYETTTPQWPCSTTSWPWWYDTTSRRRYDTTTRRPYDTTTRRHHDTTTRRHYDTTTRRYDTTTRRPYDTTTRRHYDTTTRRYDTTTRRRYETTTWQWPCWYDTTTRNWNHKTSPHPWWYDTTTRDWNHKTSPHPWWYDTTTRDWNHKTSHHPWWYDTTTRDWNHKTSQYPWWYDTTTKGWNHRTSVEPWWHHKTSPHQWWYDTTSRGWNHRTSPNQWWYNTTTRRWNRNTSPHQWWYSTTNWNGLTSRSYRSTVPINQWSTNAWGSCPPIHCPTCNYGYHHQFDWSGRCTVCYCQRNSEQTTTLPGNTVSGSPCHKDYYSQEGVIESQNWPHPYLPQALCDYRIHLSGNNSTLKTIAIRFEHFDLETCSDCSCDSLMISGLEDVKATLSMCDRGKLTIGKTYFVHSYDDHIDISFRTDGSVQKSGFRMSYYERNGTETDSCRDTSCVYLCGSTATYYRDYFGCCVCHEYHPYKTTTSDWRTTPAYERLPKSRLLQMLRDLASQAGRIGGEDGRSVSEEARSIYDIVSRFIVDNFSRRKRDAADS